MAFVGNVVRILRVFCFLRILLLLPILSMYALLIRLSLSFKTLVFPLLRVIPFVPVRVCLTPGRGKSFWLSFGPSVLIRRV